MEDERILDSIELAEDEEDDANNSELVYPKLKQNDIEHLDIQSVEALGQLALDLAASESSTDFYR